MGFFSQDCVTRIKGLDAIDDQFFGSKVRLCHQIEFALIRDVEHAAQPFGQQAPGVTRSLNGKVEQVIRYFRRGEIMTSRDAAFGIRIFCAAIFKTSGTCWSQKAQLCSPGSSRNSCGIFFSRSSAANC